MIEEDELVEELTAMFAGLEDSEGIELATRNGASALAAELALQLERDPAFDLEGWLVDHDEVVELYADEDALNAAFQPIRHRLAHGDPAPKWNDELAAPILANRDDLQARLVFGDWLQQEGDPRGELLAVQTGLRVATDPATKDRLEAQERSLLARYRSFFVGSLSRIEGFRVFWECGYFDEAQVPGIHVEDLLTLESARMLRRLDVRSDVAAVSALMKREVWPRSLRDLRIGVADAADDEDSSPDPVTLAGAGFEKLGLENLEVIADSVHLGAPLASVKRIRIDAGELAIAPGVLAGSTKLEHLELHLHESAGEELARSFTPPPPKLTHLRISATSYGGFPFAELITSPLLAQLRVLDIRGTYLHGHHVTLSLIHI